MIESHKGKWRLYGGWGKKKKTTTTNEPAARKQRANRTLAVPGLNRLKRDYAKL